ncbi:MAG: amidohydrolase family protein, partial [Chloroflexota bacterium]
GEMLRIGGVKVFADGGVCGLPAVSFEYPGGQGKGDLWFTQDEMNQIVASIHAAGYQVAIHAQGDRAIEQVLNAIELALGGEPNTARHRIEHNPFVRPDLLPRYSEVGVVANIVGPYPTCGENNEGYYSNFFGMENLSWLENWRAFVDANPDLHIAWHGDDPWIIPVSPLIEMYSLVTRKEVAEDGTVCEPPDWLASHALTAKEVLTMMTIEGAYSLFRETEVGSLEVGKLADLLILSDNPLTIDPDEINAIQIWLTMVGGVSEYCAPDRETFCP